MVTGARAKPEYRGLGITQQVGQASHRAARTNFPQLKIEVRVAADSAFHDQYTKPTQKGWEIMYKHVSININFISRWKETLKIYFFRQYHVCIVLD